MARSRLVEDMNVRHALPTGTDILSAIGKIALLHGQLDNAIRMTIKDLTSLEHKGNLGRNRQRGIARA